jgi:hypothetical protein
MKAKHLRVRRWHLDGRISVCNVLQIRLEPLGLDRRHNRYWLLLGGAETAADPASGRLFFESAADGSFRHVASSPSCHAPNISQHMQITHVVPVCQFTCALQAQHMNNDVYGYGALFVTYMTSFNLRLLKVRPMMQVNRGRGLFGYPVWRTAAGGGTRRAAVGSPGAVPGQHQGGNANW